MSEINEPSVSQDDCGRFLPIIIFGFSCCWAVTYVSAYSFAYTPVDMFSTFEQDIARVGYLGGIVLGQLLIYLLFARNPSLRNKSFRAPLSITACCALFAMILLHTLLTITSFPLVAIVAILVLAGMWQGVFHVLWAETLMHFETGRALHHVAVSVVIGAALFVATTLLTRGSALFAVLLLACFSLACYLFALQSTPRHNLPTRIVSREMAKELRKSTVTFVIYGAVFGTGIYACMLTDLPYYISYPLTGLALATGVGSLILITHRTGRVFSFNTLITALLPCVAIVLVLLTFVSPGVSWYIYLLLLMLLTVFDTSNFGFLFQLASGLRVYPLLFIVRGRIYVQLGMFAAGLANLLLVYCVDLPIIESYLIPLVLVVFLFIMVAISGKIDVLPEQLKEKVLETIPERDLLAEKRLAVKNDFSLSDREIEVLELLMRGYDTGAVAEELVISTNTVKSHTFHIYRKMGVNSKQEIVKIWNTL